MSVMFVGLGNGDFKHLHDLDADNELLNITDNGKTLIADRDLVEVFG